MLVLTQNHTIWTVVLVSQLVSHYRNNLKKLLTTDGSKMTAWKMALPKLKIWVNFKETTVNNLH